jgi:hypothetical protein
MKPHVLGQDNIYPNRDSKLGSFTEYKFIRNPLHQLHGKILHRELYCPIMKYTCPEALWNSTEIIYIASSSIIPSLLIVIPFTPLFLSFLSLNSELGYRWLIFEHTSAIWRTSATQQRLCCMQSLRYSSEFHTGCYLKLSFVKNRDVVGKKHLCIVFGRICVQILVRRPVTL